MNKENFLTHLSLFTSLSTLLCCALPALLVTLGAGAVLAGIVSSAPWLIALSHYKIWTFSISAFMLLLAGFMQWRARNTPCPIDTTQAKACLKIRKISKVIYGLSLLIWCIGFFFAFIAVHLL